MDNAKTSLSQADSYEAIGEFWDAHDLGEFWEQTRPATFEIARGAQRLYPSVATDLSPAFPPESWRVVSP